jgi:hypothetical protein
MERTCPECCKTKDYDEFYKNNYSKDKKSYYCKECHRKKRMEYYKLEGRIQQAEKRKVLLSDPVYREKRNEYFRKYAKSRRANSRAKWLANVSISTAIELGELVPPKHCELCKKETKLHGHHWHGYSPSKWLDVLWLCPECHAYQHKILRTNTKVQKIIESHIP